RSVTARHSANVGLCVAAECRRYDNPGAWLPDSVGHYFSAVVSELSCRQIWMRTFRICGRSLDSGPGGTNSLLDFLFSRGQRIVRDVYRAFLYFGFDNAV